MRLELPLRRMRVLCVAGGGHYTGSLDLRALLLRLEAVTVVGRRRRWGRARGVAEVAATTAGGTRLMLQEQQAVVVVVVVVGVVVVARGDSRRRYALKSS